MYNTPILRQPVYRRRWPIAVAARARPGGPRRWIMTELLHITERAGWEQEGDDLVVLVIDSARLPSPARYEGTEGGEQYPHITGRFRPVRLILPEPA